jgi:hypothetical protein
MPTETLLPEGPKINPIPTIGLINSFDKNISPNIFADAQSANQTVIDPLSYQPTYNDVLRSLVESKRRAKLEGEVGKLTTPSKALEKIQKEAQARYNASLNANAVETNTQRISREDFMAGLERQRLIDQEIARRTSEEIRLYQQQNPYDGGL